MSWKLYVDKDKCTGVGECVMVCPVEVFVIENGKASPTGETWCIGCESCIEVCPNNAIELDYEK